jgi:hypothetical protein
MRRLLIVVALFALTAGTESRAQLYKVYGYDTAEQGEVEAVLWTSYVAQSDNPHAFFGETVEREGLWAHTLEMEVGLTDRLMIAGYLDFQDPKGKSFSYTRARAVFLRYRFAKEGAFFFDPAVYAEYYVPRSSYSGSETLEVRLILERAFGNVNLRLNPIFEKATSGDEIEEGVEFEYAAGLYYEGLDALRPGLEFHGETGEFSGFESGSEQTHLVVPTVDFELGEVEWHLGAGLGLTDASDDVTLKSILSYEF